MGNRAPGPDLYGSQATTLDQAREQRFYILPREGLEVTEYGPVFDRIFGRKFDSMSPAERRLWYVQKLGKYYGQLRESAARNRIPVQLLAAIILNELADIKVKDVVQQQMITQLSSGSLGIAQIQVKTVLHHDLLRGYLSSTPGAGRGNAAAMLLAIPQYSIEAAAREIRLLMDILEKNPEAPFPKRLGFKPPASVAEDPQHYYDEGAIQCLPGHEGDAEQAAEDREAILAGLVAANYNFGDKFILVDHPESKTPGSYIHGLNAVTIARELFQAGLFRP